jgi:hypothetical protein
MSIAPLPPGIKIAPTPVNPVTLPVTVRADAPTPKLTALPLPEAPEADDTAPVMLRFPAVWLIHAADPLQVTDPFMVYVPAEEIDINMVFWEIRFAFSVTPDASENAPPAVAVLVPSLKASLRI